MANAIHGREGNLAITTSTGWVGELSTADIVAHINSWSLSPTKDVSEITNINQSSKVYLEGLVGATVSIEGNWVPGQSAQRDIFNKFMLIGTDSSSTGTPINDDNVNLHLVLKPIDSEEASPDNRGAMVFARAISNGLGLNVDGGSPESFTYEGTVNGDMYYIEGTSTNMGLPVKR